MGSENNQKTGTSISSKEPRKKSWLPTVAGILNVVNGVLELLGGLTIIGVAEVTPAFNDTWLGDFFGFPLIIAGIAAIIGGIQALRRRAWTLALIGAICSLFLLQWTFTGLFAVGCIVSSKREFT